MTSEIKVEVYMSGMLLNRGLDGEVEIKDKTGMAKRAQQQNQETTLHKYEY